MADGDLHPAIKSFLQKKIDEEQEKIAEAENEKKKAEEESEKEEEVDDLANVHPRIRKTIEKE